MDHGQCLSEETLAEYLDGGLDPAIKAASEAHLVACDTCRHELGFFMRLLDEDVNPQEVIDLQAIEAEWARRKPNQKDAGEVMGRRRRWILTFAGTAAALILGAVSLNLILDRAAGPDSAAEVVHLILSQVRPFEPRMSDQPHLPILRTRGSEEQGIAYGLLAGEMVRLSADSHQMGRFHLLQRNFEQAIGYLEPAEREGGAGPDIHNDLGVAYLESGESGRTAKAAGEFRHALELNAAYAPAAFNLAVFYERTGQSEAALAAWQRFLELEKDTPWASEARGRIERKNR